MALVLVFLFIVVPIVEIYVLIKVGSWLGALPTIALIVFGAVLGAFLVRWQGFELLRRVRESLARGELPAMEMLEGVIVLASGILLLVPGFITDIVGLALLIPAVRRRLIARFLTHRGPRPDGPGPGRRPYVIEGEFRREK
jgi:UPF0716 protein FxsA